MSKTRKPKSQEELNRLAQSSQPAPVKSLLRVSEARLNDMCYMVLKKVFFEPVGLGSPRQCDIRICMDLSAPERVTVMSAILLPNERAGADHTKFYDIDPAKVFDETITYLEDHWRAEFGDEWKKGAREFWLSYMVPEMMAMAEETCAVDEAKNGH